MPSSVTHTKKTQEGHGIEHEDRMERRTKKGFVEEIVFGLKMCRWKKIRKDISSAGLRVGKGMEAEMCEGTTGGSFSLAGRVGFTHFDLKCQ